VSSGKCGCGTTCGCGNVTVAAVQNAMSQLCGFADCNCGASCGCGADCGCGGTKKKEVADWVATVKAAEAGQAGCQCSKADGKCTCGDGCVCKGQC
jgi:hypothetical protein